MPDRFRAFVVAAATALLAAGAAWYCRLQKLRARPGVHGFDPDRLETVRSRGLAGPERRNHRCAEGRGLARRRSRLSGRRLLGVVSLRRGVSRRGTAPRRAHCRTAGSRASTPRSWPMTSSPIASRSTAPERKPPASVSVPRAAARCASRLHRAPPPATAPAAPGAGRGAGGRGGGPQPLQMPGGIEPPIARADHRPAAGSVERHRARPRCQHPPRVSQRRRRLERRCRRR